jgi:putative ABC transport system permease protein
VKDLWHDLSYAMRQLARNPGFAVVSVLTLALGIGANTAIFTVVDTLLLKPLALPDPGSLVQVWEVSPRGQGTASMPDLKDWQEQNSVFTGIAAYTLGDYNLNREENPERVSGVAVTAGYFDVMKAQPEFGRTFLPDEDKAGHEHEVVLSNRLWKRLGGDPAIAGQEIRLNGEDYSVVGVMSPRFSFPSAMADLWVPLVRDPTLATSRGNRMYFVVARLKPGISLATRQAINSTHTSWACLQQWQWRWRQSGSMAC